MSTLNEYYEEIRMDIAKDFGLEAGGYAPQPKLIPIHIAMRIANKYPSTSRFVPSPQGVKIANRYRSLVMGIK